MSDTRPPASDIATVAKLAAERAAASAAASAIGAQIRQEGESAKAELQKVITQVALLAVSALLGAVLWQVQRMIDKQDAAVKEQATTNERLTKVETKVDMLLKADK